MRSRRFRAKACAFTLGALVLAGPLATQGIGHPAAQDSRSLAPFVPDAERRGRADADPGRRHC